MCVCELKRNMKLYILYMSVYTHVLATCHEHITVQYWDKLGLKPNTTMQPAT